MLQAPGEVPYGLPLTMDFDVRNSSSVRMTFLAVHTLFTLFVSFRFFRLLGEPHYIAVGLVRSNPAGGEYHVLARYSLTGWAPQVSSYRLAW